MPLVMVKQRRAIIICLCGRDLRAAYLQKVYTGRPECFNRFIIGMFPQDYYKNKIYPQSVLVVSKIRLGHIFCPES